MSPSEFLLRRLDEREAALAAENCDCEGEPGPCCARQIREDIAAWRGVVAELRSEACPTDRPDHYPHEMKILCEGCLEANASANALRLAIRLGANAYAWQPGWQEAWAL